MLQAPRATAGAKACGGQHHGTFKDPKEGECSEVFAHTYLCVGPCAEYEEHKGEWIDFCKPGAPNLVDA